VLAFAPARESISRASIHFPGKVSAMLPEDSVFLFKKSLTGEFTDFTVDNLGNLYVVSLTGQLKKIGPDGDSLAVFNNVRQFGKLYLMDVSNPLKVLLYFRDFGTVVVLDRFLNTRTTIDLRKQNLFQVRAIGLSYDNNIWVYDELESMLKRVGEDGRILYQSADMRMLVDSAPSPQFIADQDRQVYLYDSLKGVYQFDYYGSFRNRIRLTGWTEFTVIGNAMFGRDADMLYKYETGSLNLQQYRIPVYMRSAKKIKITSGNLYVLQDNRLDVYSYR
jgi:hypothetical protein